MASAMAADWASLVAAAAAAVSAFATGFGVREAAKLRRLAVTPVMLVDRADPPHVELAEDDAVVSGLYSYRIRNVGQGAGLLKGISHEGEDGISRTQTAGVLGRVLAPGEDVRVELTLGNEAGPMPNPAHFSVIYQSARGEIFASRISVHPRTGLVTELEAPHFQWRS
ncbi:MAG: hypothetical protein M0Z66_15085 [Thermaerobacter sp.]|nr:hypothetical protein [Thermaerobacter sp.]